LDNSKQVVLVGIEIIYYHGIANNTSYWYIYNLNGVLIDFTEEFVTKKPDEGRKLSMESLKGTYMKVSCCLFLAWLKQTED